MAAVNRITEYFFNGYTYSEIQLLLSQNDGINISYRTLKRHLKRLNLRKRENWSLEEIIVAVQEEIKGSGQNLGCRSLTKRLLSKHGIAAGRNTIMSALQILDPEGVDLRTRHCMTRRRYFNKGPNFLIHIDGYDKLKTFGFAIHGAIDGYSRRVLWLRVAKSNNNPKIIASYYLDYVQEITGVPRCLRMDGGTENIYVEDMQKAFRWHDSDSFRGEKSIVVGSSTSNQRIERWWRSLRQMGIAFWIDFFKDLEFQGIFTTDNEVHVECLRFCFMGIIQNELDQIKKDWNSHNIRYQSRQPECPGGKPDIMFFNPELYGAVDYKFPVASVDIESLRGVCEYPSRYGCNEELAEHLLRIMHENGRVHPNSANDAKELLLWLQQNLQ